MSVIELVNRCLRENEYLSHTNLNFKSWYIRATVARVPYTKEGPKSIERDSTNYAPLSVYSIISNVLQICVKVYFSISIYQNSIYLYVVEFLPFTL